METKLVIKNVVYTPREVDVMSCIVMGVSDTKTITLILNLSNSTVENYIYNILKKFQIKSRQRLSKVMTRRFKKILIKRYMIILQESVFGKFGIRDKKNNLLFFKKIFVDEDNFINRIEEVKDIDVSFMRKLSLLREGEEKIRKEKRERIFKGMMICYWIF